jgi:hypothetical protein
MDKYRIYIISFSDVYTNNLMIIFRIFIFCLSLLFIVGGLVTILTPDLNNIFLPFETDDKALSTFARSFGGVSLAIGYLSIRFLYSHSKVGIGNVVLSIMFITLISKLFSFLYDGYTNYSMLSFILGVIFIISLYAIQRSRKYQIGDQNFLN